MRVRQHPTQDDATPRHLPCRKVPERDDEEADRFCWRIHVHMWNRRARSVWIGSANCAFVYLRRAPNYQEAPVSGWPTIHSESRVGDRWVRRVCRHLGLAFPKICPKTVSSVCCDAEFRSEIYPRPS
jgi:hypothetical protein